jgi:hypothetical protein
MDFSEIGFLKLFAQASFKLRSWSLPPDDRHEPPAPISLWSFLLVTCFPDHSLIFRSDFMHGKYRKYIKRKNKAGYWWLTSIILATWEAEIRRIMVQEIAISKIFRAKWTGGVAQTVEVPASPVWSPEFKPILPKKNERKEGKGRKRREEERKGLVVHACNTCRPEFRPQS